MFFLPRDFDNLPSSTQSGATQSQVNPQQPRSLSAAPYQASVHTPRSLQSHLPPSYSQQYGSPGISNFSQVQQPQQPPYLAQVPASDAQQSTQSFSYYPQQQNSYVPPNAAAHYSHEAQGSMAAPNTMRPTMPAMYQNPQQTVAAAQPSPYESHGRPLYGQYQGNYFPTYTGTGHAPLAYASHTQQQHQPHQPHIPAQYGQHPLQSSPVHTQVNQSARPMGQPEMQRLPTQMAPPQLAAGPPSSLPNVRSGSTSSQGAAPGPIPATTPLVISRDQEGVQCIMFEYSRDRIKVNYTIRCNTDTINVESLSREFKEANCVYPRACSFREGGYKGNRLEYETQCNNVGWALAALNPELQGKRGLIQRAVDSWRNSSGDSKLRSRRVRRLAKNNKRAQQQQQQQSHLTTSRPSSMGSLTPGYEHLQSQSTHTQHMATLKSEGSLDAGGMLQYRS